MDTVAAVWKCAVFHQARSHCRRDRHHCFGRRRLADLAFGLSPLDSAEFLENRWKRVLEFLRGVCEPGILPGWPSDGCWLLAGCRDLIGDVGVAPHAVSIG